MDPKPRRGRNVPAGVHGTHLEARVDMHALIRCIINTEDTDVVAALYIQEFCQFNVESIQIRR